MPQKGLLILLSAVTFAAAVAVLLLCPTEFASAIGQVMAAFAGTLAVIWFSASLYYQSQQLQEQKAQFLENFKQLREDNRRGALLVARDVLSRAEERALKSNPDLKSIGDLTTCYVDVQSMAMILKSKDANAILEVGKKWMLTQEGPAVFMMRGIKNAAEVYFRATGNEKIDYSKEPEEFVFIYGPTLWKLPFFDEYGGLMTLLSEFMFMLAPGRASARLAYTVAAFKQAVNTGIGNIYREDKILEDIKKHKEAGYPIPPIAEDLAEKIA